jgi:hypothetical protein
MAGVKSVPGEPDCELAYRATRLPRSTTGRNAPESAAISALGPPEAPYRTGIRITFVGRANSGWWYPKSAHGSY